MFNLKNKNIAVVGDAIVDDYYFVKADKISPEFPIPILQCENSFPNKRLLGGSTNVCYQFLNIKNVLYFGLIDLDVYNLLSDFSFINSESCCLLPNYSKNPVKKRFYQNSFPLCRIDIESKNYNLSDLELNKLQNKICENLKSYNLDAVIFSDYDKGLFNNFEVKKYFDSLGEKTLKIVDPKKGPVSKWKGCDLIKPNYKEALHLTEKENYKDQIEFIKKNTDCEIIIITMEGDGVVGCVGQEFFEYVPNEKTQASSVIGAGDCFISLLCSGLLSQFSIEKSVEIAFKGSSLYVKNKFNNPINPAELFHKKIFTSGVFDLLHKGHLQSLIKSKELGDKLIVGINSDASTKRLKGNNRPINDQETRKKILESLECVDEVFIFDEDTPYELIKKIKPDIITKGSDYTKENVVGNDLCEVVIIPNLQGFSTTSTISKFVN